MTTWRLILSLPEPALPAFEAVFEPLEGAIVTDARNEQGLVPWQLFLAEAPDDAEVQRLVEIACEVSGVHSPLLYSLERLPDVDWVVESQKALPAITIGRIRVRGSHITEPAPPGALDLLIDANVAFGTGRHETTRGCLQALQDIARRRSARAVSPVLDMGCGSGVLAMAAAKLWPCRVVAVDNDLPSLRTAQANLKANEAADRVSLILSDGFRDARVRRNGPYQLIVANILADPLCAMAEQVRRNLAPGGLVVLSGLLVTQERQVQARYRAAGLVLERRYRLAEWSTLVLTRG